MHEESGGRRSTVTFSAWQKKKGRKGEKGLGRGEVDESAESYTGVRSGSCLNLLHDFVRKLRVLCRYKYRVRNWSAF